MAEEDIRVGLIGAGGNVRNRHIPRRKVERLQILSSQSQPRVESSCRRAVFDIPGFTAWQELLTTMRSTPSASTWPYMHRTLTGSAGEGQTRAD